MIEICKFMIEIHRLMIQLTNLCFKHVFFIDVLPFCFKTQIVRIMENKKTMDDLREHLLLFAPEYPIKIGYVVRLMLQENEKIPQVLQTLRGLIHTVEPEKQLEEECLSAVLHNMKKVFLLKRSNLIGNWQRLVSFLNELFDVPFVTQPAMVAQPPDVASTLPALLTAVKSELEDASPSSSMSAVRSELEEKDASPSATSPLSTAVKSELEDSSTSSSSSQSRVVTPEPENVFISRLCSSTIVTSEKTSSLSHFQSNVSHLVVGQLMNEHASETAASQLNAPAASSFVGPKQPSSSAEPQTSLGSSCRSPLPKKRKRSCAGKERKITNTQKENNQLQKQLKEKVRCYREDILTAMINKIEPVEGKHKEPKMQDLSGRITQELLEQSKQKLTGVIKDLHTAQANINNLNKEMKRLSNTFKVSEKKCKKVDGNFKSQVLSMVQNSTIEHKNERPNIQARKELYANTFDIELDNAKVEDIGQESKDTIFDLKKEVETLEKVMLGSSEASTNLENKTALIGEEMGVVYQ